MASPYLNNGLSMTTPFNMMGPAARVLQNPSNSVLPQNLYHPQFLSPTNSTLDLSMVKPIIPNVASGTSSNPLWMGKERDNTWLQLPVCPVFYRFYKENEGVLGNDGEVSYNLKDPKESGQPECNDATCHSGFAHPPSNVMKHVLTSGYVVCCQSYVFATKNGTTAQNSGCVRGEDKCRYFHPPENLAQIVINAGRNNKRLRSEMETKLKMSTALGATSLGSSPTNLPYQISNPYSLFSQNHTSHPIINMAGAMPSVSNGISNLSLGALTNSLSNSTACMNTAAVHKPSSSLPSNLRSFAHHSSPAVDYRQPSPPGVTQDKLTKEDDFTMAPPTSRKRIYHDENKNVGYVGMKPVSSEEKDLVAKPPATKESPVAKRRHGDLTANSNHPHQISNSQTALPTSIGSSFMGNGEVHSIPNLVSPTPHPVDAATLYSKAWAQQMKILQQSQNQLIYNTSAVNPNITSQLTALSGINRPSLNGIAQVGSFDVNAYNAALYLNQSLAAAHQTNPAASAYTSSAATHFPTQYNIYDPSNTFWF